MPSTLKLGFCSSQSWIQGPPTLCGIIAVALVSATPEKEAPGSIPNHNLFPVGWPWWLTSRGPYQIILMTLACVGVRQVPLVGAVGRPHSRTAGSKLHSRGSSMMGLPSAVTSVKPPTLLQAAFAAAVTAANVVCGMPAPPISCSIRSPARPGRPRDDRSRPRATLPKCRHSRRGYPSPLFMTMLLPCACSGIKPERRAVASPVTRDNSAVCQLAIGLQESVQTSKIIKHSAGPHCLNGLRLAVRSDCGSPAELRSWIRPR